MLVSLFGNTFQDPSLGDLKSLIATLLDEGMDVEVERDFYDWLTSALTLSPRVRRVSEPSRGTAMVISCGGDGTLLRAARWVGEREIPVAGINTGHLGFLTAWHTSDISSLVRSIKRDEVKVEARTLVQLISPALEPEVWPYALNEIALLKENTGSMITIRAEVDGRFLADYEADGLLIATPSGSTAYNLSAGGPILQPDVPAFILNPVCPHMLTMRPLVINDSCVVRTVVASRTGRFLVSIDGTTVSLASEVPLEMRRAPFTLRLVRRDGDDFSSALRDKLLWGANVSPRSV